jgi:DNA replication protein DnaC
MRTVVTLETLLPRLRQLTLSGMHAAIATRTQEARARALDPLELLQLLLDDELARREAESVTRRMQRARFEDVCDLRDFDFTYNPELPKAQLWELASGRFLEEKASIVLCGPTGVGKTFVAQALGVAACRAARRVFFTTTSAVLADLAGGRADGSWPVRLRRSLSPELLILDDFGVRNDSALHAEDLYEVVSRRYRRGSLLLTTNRAPKDRSPLFPNPVVAEGLLDRLLNSAYIVTMLGRSYRPQQRPREHGVHASTSTDQTLLMATEAQLAHSDEHETGK